jgi:hypothetical protein
MNSRRLGLLVGLLLSFPALWAALVTGQLAPGMATGRVLAGLLLGVAGVGVVGAIIRAYEPADGADTSASEARTGVVMPHPGRRATDGKDEVAPAGDLPAAPTGQP